METNIHNVKTELITLVCRVSGIMEHMWSAQNTEPDIARYPLLFRLIIRKCNELEIKHVILVYRYGSTNLNDQNTIRGRKRTHICYSLLGRTPHPLTNDYCQDTGNSFLQWICRQLNQ